MRQSQRVAALCIVALGCAGARVAPVPAPAPSSPPPPTREAKPAPAPPPPASKHPSDTPAISPGLSASQVRQALGAPLRVERLSSSLSGAVYERWVYPEREVVLLDGFVVDVVP